MVEASEDGYLETHYTRSTGIRYVADAFLTFVMLHYFQWIFVLIFAVVCLDVSGWLCRRTLMTTCVLYGVQLVLWRPQFKNGWPLVFRKYLFGVHMSDSLLRNVQATIIREAELDPKEGYLFSWSPHGLVAVARIGAYGSAWEKMFNGMPARWASFSMGFYIPIVREYSFSAGCVDAGRETLIRLKENIHLIPGGIREMNLTDSTSTVTYHTVKNRNGFIKLAVDKGFKIVPVVCFGEKWMYERYTFPWPINRMLTALKMSPSIPSGRWRTMMPKEIDLGWVYGKPIETKERSIEEIQLEYYNEVHRIFSTYKARFGYAEEESLEIVEPGFDPRKK